MIGYLQLLVKDGGVIVIILLGVSIIACAMILIKLCQLAWLKWFVPNNSREALSCWHRSDAAGAIKCLSQGRHPLDRIVRLALRGALESRSSTELLREEINRVAVAELNRLGILLRPLELIATLSPLLGLLGTVLGMIEAFRQLELAGNQVDPAILSGGIWQALLTTAIGLSIAIPVMVAHSYLERCVDEIKLQMEDMVTQIFTTDLVDGGSGKGRQYYPDTSVIAAEHAV